MEWNPVPHMQHAWEKATTFWGKIALVLFYSYIWLGIIGTAWQMFDPTSFGMGCMLDQYDLEKSERDDFIASLRMMDTLIIGLLIYADFLGFQTKNVALLTIIVIVWEVFMIPSMDKLYEGNCTSMIWQIWINPLWMILAWICMVMEDKLGNHAEGYTEISA